MTGLDWYIISSHIEIMPLSLLLVRHRQRADRDRRFTDR